MARISKALCLVVLTMVATGAFAAEAGAEGQGQLTAESSAVTIDGTGELLFTRLGRTIHCKAVSYGASSSSGATSIVGTLNSQGCESPSVKGPATHTPVEFDVELIPIWIGPIRYFKIKFRFKGTSTHIYSSETNHTAGTTLCSYEFAAQGPLSSIVTTNEPAGGSTPKDWIQAHFEVGGIKSTSAKNLLVCGAAENETATLTGTLALKGTNAAGEATGITLSDD